jgi:putative PIN family toxin of toxin-antitoxin system
MKPNRVVLDTNVLVSALMSSLGNPAKIYKMFLSETIVLVFSEDIMLEYEDVLYRPHLHIPADDAGKVLDAIRLCGERVEPTPSTIPMIDEDDRVFYDAAKSAGAYLITGNMRHYPSESFIFTPAEYLKS